MRRTTKSKIKKVIRNITADFLEKLYDVSSHMLAASIDKKTAYRIFYQNYRHSTPDGFAKWLCNLRSRGYVRYDNKSIEFTTKTKIKLARIIGDRIEESDIYTFFSFDVPEIFRKHRERFRRSIKNLGCRQVQKSLWVTNKDIYQLVQEFAYDCGIEKFLICIISNKTDIDGVLDEMFLED